MGHGRRGKARLGRAGPGPAVQARSDKDWCDGDWFGEAGQRRSGGAWQGLAERSMARKGKAGMAGHSNAGPGWVWQVVQGTIWHGTEGPGVAGVARTSGAGYGEARTGWVRVR